MRDNRDHDKIFQDEEIRKWESREWGADPEYAEHVQMPAALQELLNKGSEENGNTRMQLISIRLPVSLIEDLKRTGKEESIGYQTLTRDILIKSMEERKHKNINKILAENKKLEKQIEEMRNEKMEGQG